MRCERLSRRPATRRDRGRALRDAGPGARVGARRRCRDHRARSARTATTRCVDYTRRFDTARRRRRRRCASRDGELDAAARALDPDGPRRPRAGDRERRARWPRRAGTRGRHGRARRPRGRRCARRRSRRAAVYVPGGRAPYPSTVVMGVVTARGWPASSDIAVCAPPGSDGDVDPVVLAACRLAGASVVYRMGGAQAIAALAYGTETVAAGRRDRRSRQPVRAGGQAPGVRPGRDRRLRRAERPAGDRRPATRDPEPLALDLLAQAEHGPGTLVVAISDSPELLDALGAAPRRCAPTPARSCALVEVVRRSSRRWRWPRRSRPSTSSWSGTDAEALAPRVTQRRLRVRRRGRRDRVRRLHRRLQPHAARPTARPGSPRRSAPRTSAGASPRCGSRDADRARPGGRAARPRRGVRAARPVDGGAHPRQWRAMTPHRRDRPQDRRDRRSTSSLALDGDGRRRARHRRRLLRPHARPAGPPRAPRPDRPRPRRSRDRRPPHRRGRRHLPRPGARPGARRPRRHHPLRPGDGADGRGARRRARSTSPAAACARSRRRCRPARSATSTTS